MASVKDAIAELCISEIDIYAKAKKQEKCSCLKTPRFFSTNCRFPIYNDIIQILMISDNLLALNLLKSHKN